MSAGRKLPTRRLGGRGHQTNKKLPFDTEKRQRLSFPSKPPGRRRSGLARAGAGRGPCLRFGVHLIEEAPLSRRTPFASSGSTAPTGPLGRASAIRLPGDLRLAAGAIMLTVVLLAAFAPPPAF